MSRVPILFQDEHLVAVHKPSGLLVHRTRLDAHEREFLFQRVRQQIGRQIHAVHRLDKATSGVILFALDLEAARRLSSLFERQQVCKEYLAVVRGVPPLRGSISSPLLRRAEDAGNADTAEILRPAQTFFQRLAEVELPYRVDRYPTSRYALLHVTPATGRRHQIRRHLKHISHPIIGDTTYGKSKHNRLFTERFGSNRLLLACTALHLTHPFSGESLSIRSPLEGNFATVLESIGWGKHLAELYRFAVSAAPGVTFTGTFLHHPSPFVNTESTTIIARRRVNHLG